MTDQKTTRPQFLSFEDWLKENEELADQEFETLDGCKDCPDCDGTGKIYFGDKDEYEFKQHMRELYDEQIKADTKKLEVWNRIVKEET